MTVFVHSGKICHPLFTDYCMSPPFLTLSTKIRIVFLLKLVSKLLLKIFLHNQEKASVCIWLTDGIDGNNDCWLMIFVDTKSVSFDE